MAYGNTALPSMSSADWAMPGSTAKYTWLLENWILLLHFWYLWKRPAPSISYDFDCSRRKRCLVVRAPLFDFIFVKKSALTPYAYYFFFAWQLQGDRGCWPEASIIWHLAISAPIFYFCIFNASSRMPALGQYWKVDPGGSDIKTHRQSFSISSGSNRMTHPIWNYYYLGSQCSCFSLYLLPWFCISDIHFIPFRPFSTFSGYPPLFLNNYWFWRSILRNRSFRRRCLVS